MKHEIVDSKNPQIMDENIFEGEVCKHPQLDFITPMIVSYAFKPQGMVLVGGLRVGGLKELSKVGFKWISFIVLPLYPLLIWHKGLLV